MEDLVSQVKELREERSKKLEKAKPQVERLAETDEPPPDDFHQVSIRSGFSTFLSSSFSHLVVCLSHFGRYLSTASYLLAQEYHERSLQRWNALSRCKSLYVAVLHSILTEFVVDPFSLASRRLSCSVAIGHLSIHRRWSSRCFGSQR